MLPGPLLNVLGFIAVGLFYIGPLLLGMVTGTAYVFRLEKYGWLRLLACGVVAPLLLAVSLWLIVVAVT